jgi:hypothetical protein
MLGGDKKCCRSWIKLHREWNYLVAVRLADSSLTTRLHSPVPFFHHRIMQSSGFSGVPRALKFVLLVSLQHVRFIIQYLVMSFLLLTQATCLTGVHGIRYIAALHTGMT